MKKKIIFLGLLFILFPLFADDMYRQGAGAATAIYFGTTAKIRAYDMWANCLTNATKYKIEKLTREENDLLWGALNKYNCKNNEVYLVGISPNIWQYRFLDLYVEIQKDGSIIYYGWEYPYGKF